MAAANECPSSVHHVDGHGEALKRYMPHRLMQHVQGYTGRSNWMRLLAPYRLGGRQGDSKQNSDVSCPPLIGYFGGHRNAAVLYRAHRPMEEVQGFHISH